MRISYPDAARSLVHEREIAAVSVRAPLDRDLADQAIEVTGPEVLTQREQIAAIGGALVRQLHVEEQPSQEARCVCATELGEQFADAALAHWGTLVDAPERATGDVERITGQPARSFADWAREHAQDFASSSSGILDQQHFRRPGTGCSGFHDAIRLDPIEVAAAHLSGSAQRQDRLDCCARRRPLLGLARARVRSRASAPSPISTTTSPWA